MLTLIHNVLYCTQQNEIKGGIIMAHWLTMTMQRVEFIISLDNEINGIELLQLLWDVQQ